MTGKREGLYQEISGYDFTFTLASAGVPVTARLATLSEAYSGALPDMLAALVA